LKFHDTLQIISGTIFEGPVNTIGNGVGVPSHFYKVFYNPQKNQGVAFILPHEENTRHKLKEYMVTIDSLESRTSIDFFGALDSVKELSMEKNFDKSLWPLKY